MNSFRLFGLKRKLAILNPVEDFFELRSRATEGEKVEKWGQKSNFSANFRSSNEFNKKLTNFR